MFLTVLCRAEISCGLLPSGICGDAMIGLGTNTNSSEVTRPARPSASTGGPSERALEETELEGLDARGDGGEKDECEGALRVCPRWTCCCEGESET